MTKPKKTLLITPSHLLAELQGHIGESNGISAADLCLNITGYKLPNMRRQLRKIIMQLRNEGQHICGTPSTGYFIANNADELNATAKFLYNRAMTSLQQIAAMQRVSLPDLAGQLRIRL